MIILLSVLSMACCSRAQDFFAGARSGLSFHDGGQTFYQTEAFAGVNLARHWNLSTNWYFQPGGDISAGGLTDGTATGFIGTIEPTISLHRADFPLSLEIGVGPTLISRYHFGGKDFGDNFQITSQAQLNWQLTKRFSLGGRVQHMSNAHLATHNPGLNMVMLTAGFRF